MLAVVTVALSACGRPAAANQVNIQLSTWGSAQEVAVLKTLLQDFERTHPRLHVELLHIPENYYQKLHILIAGGMAPDVIFTNSISFPIYASQGVFRDLSPFLASDSDQAEESRRIQVDGPEGLSSIEADRSQAGPGSVSPKPSRLRREDFYPAALKAFTWQEAGQKAVLGALPRDVSNLVIFYNRDLFRKAGLSEPSAGWTWEEFRETARSLTIDANRDGVPEQFGFSFYATPPLFWLPFAWSAGGDLFSANLQDFMLDQPQAVRGLQWYADLRNRWHVAPRKVESGGATMSQLFMQQKLAMLVSGRWSVPVLREQAAFRWDVAPLPVGPGGQSKVGIDASGYAIAARSPHPRESFELIRFLLSRAAVEKATASGLIVPARPDVARSAFFLNPKAAPVHSQAFLAVISEGVPTHTPPRWNEISEALNLALEPVWDGKQDASSALKAAKPEIERMLETGP